MNLLSWKFQNQFPPIQIVLAANKSQRNFSFFYFMAVFIFPKYTSKTYKINQPSVFHFLQPSKHEHLYYYLQPSGLYRFYIQAKLTNNVKVIWHLCCVISYLYDYRYCLSYIFSNKNSSLACSVIRITKIFSFI